MWELTWAREQERSYCLVSATIMETCLLVWPDLNFLKRNWQSFLFCFIYIWGIPTLKHGQQIYILRTSSGARGIAQGQSSCLVFIHLESFLESVSPYGHHSVRHYLYWVWWITPLIPAPRRQRQEHCPKFNDRLVYTERSRLGYSVRPCLKQNQRTKRTKIIKEFGGST